MATNAKGTQFFHIFQAMRESGDVAAMGPHAFTVYSIIKSYVGIENPTAFPSIEQLVEDVGFSKSTVIRSIQKLVEMGYVHKEMVGRNAQYTVQERIPIVNESGEVQTTATWEYIPKFAVETVNELVELLKGNADPSGAGMKYVHIGHLQVVISQLEEGASQQIINGDLNQSATTVDSVGSKRIKFKNESE